MYIARHVGEVHGPAHFLTKLFSAIHVYVWPIYSCVNKNIGFYFAYNEQDEGD